MLGDVLVGKPPEYNGVITNLTGIHTGDVWYLDRRFVVRTLPFFVNCNCSLLGSCNWFLMSALPKMQVAMVVVVFLLPLTLQRCV